jgi:hypothetical protein
VVCSFWEAVAGSLSVAMTAVSSAKVVERIGAEENLDNLKWKHRNALRINEDRTAKSLNKC